MGVTSVPLWYWVLPLLWALGGSILLRFRTAERYAEDSREPISKPKASDPEQAWFQRMTRHNLIILTVAAAALVFGIAISTIPTATTQLTPAELAALITSGTAVVTCAAAGVQSIAAWRTAKKPATKESEAPAPTTVEDCFKEAWQNFTKKKRPSAKEHELIAAFDQEVLWDLRGTLSLPVETPAERSSLFAIRIRQAIGRTVLPYHLRGSWKILFILVGSRSNRKVLREYVNHLENALDRLPLTPSSTDPPVRAALDGTYRDGPLVQVRRYEEPRRRSRAMSSEADSIPLRPSTAGTRAARRVPTTEARVARPILRRWRFPRPEPSNGETVDMPYTPGDPAGPSS